MPIPSHDPGGEGKGRSRIAVITGSQYQPERIRATIGGMSDDPEDKVTRLPQSPEAIELRHLRAFVAVAEELNFGRAASRLYLSQPALSRQIRTLERLVGCDLLRRTTHRVELTLAGEALLDRARQLLGDLDEAVTVTRSVGGELASRIAGYWRFLGEPAVLDAELQNLRDGFEAVHAKFGPPPEVEVRPINTGGVSSLVLAPRPDCPATVLHVHGGAFVMGSAFGYRTLAGALAVAADTGVLVPDFRLAPEHPFPAALEDVLRAYLWLLDSGADPGRLCVSGDSSGASLALSLLITLKQQELPQPGRLILLSPGVDLDRVLYDRPAADPDPVAGEPQPVISIEHLRRFTNMYLAGHPADDPVVSPLTADLTGLPPMLISVGSGDPVVEDAHRLAEHARRHGVEVRLDLYPVTAHLFHLFWSFLPEAANALGDAGRFARMADPAATVSRAAAGQPRPPSR
jgi:monoterpene epsilon-lactone hydrolase